MLTNPIREENGELKQHLSPVLNTTRPFADDVHRREVEHFEQSFIRREDAFTLRDFAELTVVALDDVGCVDRLSNFRWIFEEGSNLVLYGPVGTGKTHLAIAAGLRACELGKAVKFYTVAELVMRLGEAKRGGTLEKLMSEIGRTQLLILDEWGYIPVDKEGAQLLFRVIADSYESRSLIITTNLEFSKWGSVFTDDQMAAAMIDRLAHHGHLLVFEGESYRMKHALMKER